jgi:hypothetical protein
VDGRVVSSDVVLSSDLVLSTDVVLTHHVSRQNTPIHNIQERVTAVLRSIPKEAFADSFQKVYERCQQCVVKDGDYLEGQ